MDVFDFILKKRWRELLMVMVKKEIKVKYNFSVFGLWWMFIIPILQMIVIGVLFGRFVLIKVDNYFIFLLCGLIPWNFFSVSLLRGTVAIVAERSLIQKACFPRELIVVSGLLSNFISFVISVILLCLLVFVNSLFRINWQMVLLPVVLLWSLLLGAGFIFLFSAYNSKYRDVGLLVGVLINLWFYITPIIYDFSLIPVFWGKLIYLINPVVGLVESYRWIFLNIEPWWWFGVGVSFVECLSMVVFGFLVFKKMSLFFDDWM